MQKVWYRKSKQAWYATILEGGQQKQIQLIKAPNSKDGRKQAEDELVRELADRDYSQARAASEPTVQAWITVGHVLRGFLKHSREEHSPETAAWHKSLLDPFIKTWGKLSVSRLRKKHVKKWVKVKGYRGQAFDQVRVVLLTVQQPDGVDRSV